MSWNAEKYLKTIAKRIVFTVNHVEHSPKFVLFTLRNDGTGLGNDSNYG